MSKNILQDRPEAQKALGILNEHLKNIREEMDNSPTLRTNEYLMHIGALERGSKQFESSISIIVSLGMLKAGKSTLVNILARHPMASPTGYGYDTTLRPALIRMKEESDVDSDKGNITIYHYEPERKNTAPSPNGGNALEAFDGEGRQRNTPSKDTNDEDIETAQRNNNLKKVLDRLRKISGSDNFRTTILELTEENLELALCKDVNSPDAINIFCGIEPLIVVVETPYQQEGVLLRDGRMLMDMPGLDSAKADAALHFSRYSTLINESDAALFVQSSVAPLNAHAQKHLKASLKTRSSATIYVVQNKMLAKPWLKSTINADAQNKQLGHALQLVNELAQEVSGAKPAQFQINLGMASDSMFTSPEKFHDQYRLECKDSPSVTKETLWALSEMEKFEKALKEGIDRNGIHNRIVHCCDVLTNDASQFLEFIDTEKQKREKILQDLSNDQTTWKDIKADLLHDMDAYKYKMPGTVSFAAPPNLNAIVNRIEQEKGISNQKKVSGSKIDDFLNDLNRELCKYCKSLLENSCFNSVRVAKHGSDIALDQVCAQEVKDLLIKWQNNGDYKKDTQEKKAELFMSLSETEKPEYDSDISRMAIGLNTDSFTVCPVRSKFRKENATWKKILSAGFAKEQCYDVTHGVKPWDSDVTDPGGLLSQYENNLNTYLDKNMEDCFSNIVREELSKGTKRLKEALDKRISDLDKEKSNTEAEIKSLERITALLNNTRSEISIINNSN